MSASESRVGDARGGEAIGCPLCGDVASSPVIEENGWTGRQCSDCGLIYVSPRPTAEEIATLYEQDQAYLPADLFLSAKPTAAARLATHRRVGLLRRFAAGGKLLEIGPGSGAILAEASRRGFTPYGVEASPAQAEHIRTVRGIPCVGSLDEVAELGAAPFDLVYHRDVLSHFYDPVDEFHRIGELLAPRGWHIFETGNLGDVDRRYFKYFKSFQYPDHLFFHSTESLRRLLERTGFELVHLDRTSIVPGMWQAVQLRRLAAALGRARGGGSSGGGGDGAGPTRAAPPRRLARSSATARARALLDLTRYGADLAIGRIRPRRDEPQTVVVVARKR